MEQSDIWDAAAARRYDTPGEDMFAPEVRSQPLTGSPNSPVLVGPWSLRSAQAGWQSRWRSAALRSAGSNFPFP